MMTLLVVISAIVWPLALLGLVIILQLFKSKPPVDDSNIFNRLRILWYSISRMSQMVEKFPWLLNDEWKNLTGED